MSTPRSSRSLTDRLSRVVGAGESRSSAPAEDAAALAHTVESVEAVASAEPAEPAERTNGLGRVLITVYLILALAATLRAIFQIITKFDEAPVAYSLSLASGIVYAIATIALTRRTRVWWVIAWAALIFEMVGVLLVGTLSIVMPDWFAHDSVWSYFGMNYFWIPLVLPVLGMLWLRQQSQQGEPEPISDSRESVY